MPAAKTKRYGRQTPTSEVIVPYKETLGPRAIDRYKASGREPQPWQEALVYDIKAIDDEGLYSHAKFGYQVPRRNGKGEILTIVELDEILEGHKVLHTAHRSTTSSSAARRLAEVLNDCGYTEIQRPQVGETYPGGYKYDKKFGLEKITMFDTGGTIDFRTRTAKGGLGEGFDTLIIDEAQEYTDDQQSSLQYVVSDSMNPQIILCGTPPTMVSGGTIFTKLRNAALAGETEETGWAEWSVDYMTDVNDVDAWYETNPAMGYHLTERKIRNEDKTDDLDFNIQRLGYWSKHNLKSAVTMADWSALKCEEAPDLNKAVFAGVKFTSDSASLAVAAETKDGKIMVEALDCQTLRNGVGWIADLLKDIKPEAVAIDGQAGQQLLADALDARKVKAKKVLPTVKEAIVANANFEQMVYSESICHTDQQSLTQVVTNCMKRSIGNNGGFGYKALIETMDIGLMDAAILAIWQCTEHKGKAKTKQRVRY